MSEYIIYNTLTIFLPLSIMFCVSFNGYLDMRDRYIELKGKYEEEFRETKVYKKYQSRMKRREKCFEPFKFKDFDEE